MKCNFLVRIVQYKADLNVLVHATSVNEPPNPSVTSSAWVSVYKDTNYRARLTEIKVDQTGRYVAIYTAANSVSTFLKLSEVEVYGFIIEGMWVQRLNSRAKVEGVQMHYQLFAGGCWPSSFWVIITLLNILSRV